MDWSLEELEQAVGSVGGADTVTELYDELAALDLREVSFDEVYKNVLAIVVTKVLKKTK